MFEQLKKETHIANRYIEKPNCVHYPVQTSTCKFSTKSRPKLFLLQSKLILIIAVSLKFETFWKFAYVEHLIHLWRGKKTVFVRLIMSSFENYPPH